MRINNLIFVLLVLFFSTEISLTQPPDYEMYGYFDMEAHINNKDSEGKRGTFQQHHFNMINVFQLDNHFRVFGEIEWENGTSMEAEGESSGSIVLERAWVEYKYSDAFKVKIGKSLSPFGIYNLIHDASPTFLSTIIPTSIYGKHENTVGSKQMLYPKFSTGVQVLGTLFKNQWEVGYYLYLSNGRGPDPSHVDNNSNKGIGGRLVVNPPVRDLRLGISYYADKNGNANNTRQRTLAFDASFEHSDISLQAEFFIPELEEVGGDSIPTGEFRQGSGYYMQGAYTFFDRITPFARLDFYEPNMDEDNDTETDFVVGINYSITSGVYLKSEIHLMSFENRSLKNYEKVDISIAVAF